MASSDIRASGVDSPIYYPGQTGRSSSPWVGITIDTSSNPLDDFLYDGKPRTMAEAAPAADTRPAAPGLDCQQCGAQLSAVERKMERCLSCGKDSHAGGLTAEMAAARQQMTVGI
jgi:hypothetical protein